MKKGYLFQIALIFFSLDASIHRNAGPVNRW